MSKSIQNKGWNGMKSLLEDHMPTQRTHRGKLLLLGFLFISISGILGYYFGKNSGNPQIETPIAEVAKKSLTQQPNNENSLDNTKPISEAKQSESKSELLNIHEDLILPTKRIWTLVEVSPVRQVESNTDPTANANQFSVESYIEEAKFSSREEILFESISIPMEDHSAILIEGIDNSKESGNKNILAQDISIDIDETEPVSISETETETETVIEEASITEIQPEILKQRKHVFSLSAAATTQTYAIRHVGVQSGIEYDYRVSPKWSLFLNSGMELRNIYHTNQQALIKETRSNIQNTEISFSLDGRHNVAQVNYDYIITAYLGTGVRYNLSSKWILYTGFTFHPLISMVKRSVSHLPTYADGSLNNEILYPEEIELNYNTNKTYELSTTLGATFFPRRKFGITMFYQHGFRGLLKYDLQNFDLNRRGVGLGIQYVL